MSLLLFELWEGLMAALRAIAAHKLRAVLTTLGIIIGIVAVTLMATVINGIERDFNESLSELGTDVLYVEKWPWIVGPGSRWWEYINRPDITPELADVIEEQARYVVAAVPVLDRMGTARYGGITISSLTIVGAEADYPGCMRWTWRSAVSTPKWKSEAPAPCACWARGGLPTVSRRAAAGQIHSSQRTSLPGDRRAAAQGKRPRQSGFDRYPGVHSVPDLRTVLWHS